MDETVGLKEIFQIINRRKKYIIAITLTATLIMAIYSLFLAKPLYEASAEVIIVQGGDDLSEYKQTYADFISSQKLLNTLIKEFNLDCTPEQLKKRIDFSSNESSAILSIAVEDEEMIQAVRIVNRIIEISVKETSDFATLAILTEAEVYGDEQPVKPNLVLNLALGFTIGLVASIGVAIILELMDTTVRTENDVETKLKLPLLGFVSTYKNKDKNHL